jgi:hypothetical protein
MFEISERKHFFDRKKLYIRGWQMDLEVTKIEKNLNSI